jgi:transposase InsO family protein
LDPVAEELGGDEQRLLENIASSQTTDPFSGPILRYLLSKEIPPGKTEMEMEQASARFYCLEGKLYFFATSKRDKKNPDLSDLRLYVPEHLRPLILRAYHDQPLAGHLGEKRTLWRVKQAFFWPGLHSDVLHYVQSCIPCQKRRRVRGRRGFFPLGPVSVPVERVGMDFLTGFPTSVHGNNAILVITDYCTRYATAIAVPEMSAETTARAFLDRFALIYGIPQQVLTDQGSNFESKFMRVIYDALGTTKLRTSTYHPETNGLTERFNSTLCDMLAKYVESDQRRWDEYLSARRPLCLQ